MRTTTLKITRKRDVWILNHIITEDKSKIREIDVVRVKVAMILRGQGQHMLGGWVGAGK